MLGIKCVIVGDGDVGKTCLLISYTTNAFPAEYVPNVFDSYSLNMMFEEQVINLQIWDTAGHEYSKKLRPLSYPQTDVFILCFSLVSPTSLENVQNMWKPEITEHCPTTPFVLVGMKSDLRDEFAQHTEEFKQKGMEPVPQLKGDEMQKLIGARSYIECSTLKNCNVNKVFDEAIKAVLHHESGPIMNEENETGSCELI